MNIILIDYRDVKKIYSHKEDIDFQLFVNKRNENLFLKYSDKCAELISKKHSRLMRIERISMSDMFDEWEQCEYIGTMGIENKKHVFQGSWWYVAYIPIENEIRSVYPLTRDMLELFHLGEFHSIGNYWVNITKTKKGWYVYDIVGVISRSVYSPIESPRRICNLVYRALKDHKLDVLEKIAALLRLGVEEIGNIKLEDLCFSDFIWYQEWNPPEFSWDKIEKAIYEEETAYKVIRNLP